MLQICIWSIISLGWYPRDARDVKNPPRTLHSNVRLNMPTFINIKAGFPKTISWESNGVHTSLRRRWLTQFYSSIKNELIMQTPKWDVARSRGKTIYLHRRNYDGALWIKYVAGCHSNEDVVCDGRQGCLMLRRKLPTATAIHNVFRYTDKYFLPCVFDNACIQNAKCNW